MNPLSTEKYRLKLCCFSYPLKLVFLVFISFRQLCRLSDASLRSTSNTAHLSTTGAETQSYGVHSESSSVAKVIKVSLREPCMHGVCDDRDEEKGQRDSSPHHRQFRSFSPGTTVPPVANRGQHSPRRSPIIAGQRELPIYRTDIPTCLKVPVLPRALMGCYGLEKFKP